jgi:hypothetical protein
MLLPTRDCSVSAIKAVPDRASKAINRMPPAMNVRASIDLSRQADDRRKQFR